MLNQLKRALGRETEIGMAVWLNISSYQQISIAMLRRFLGNEGFEDEDVAEESKANEDDKGCIFNKDNSIFNI
jgi:hypothetical protein